MSRMQALATATVLSLALIVVNPQVGHGQLFGGSGIVYDPIHHATTVLNHAEALLQTAAQVEMLRDMIENSRRAGSPSWGELAAILDQMEATLQSGQAIAYTLEGLDGRFRDAFPGYDPADDYARLYRGWSGTLLDTLRATLAATGVNARDARTIEDTLDVLRRRNATASGRMQALQIANALASRELEELAKLRQLIAASTNAQNVYLATREAREAASVASFERFLGEPGAEIPSSPAASERSFRWPFSGTGPGVFNE
ncbi:MAG: P-type conjugative transfer protein TrbJ [bacterium]|nr:P-type conjugative transfer protein TrbJ [bacterium]